MHDVVARMRKDLAAAMRAQDQGTVRVLRTALASIANAEAHPVPEGRTAIGDETAIAGATAGLGATDVARRELSPTDVTDLVRAERDDHLASAAELESHGAGDEAARLRAEADVLDRYL